MSFVRAVLDPGTASSQGTPVLDPTRWTRRHSVLVGIAVGLWTSFAVSRYVSAFLYGVDPHDALSFGAVSVLLAVVTVAACIVPARRAASVNPLQALRVR